MIQQGLLLSTNNWLQCVTVLTQELQLPKDWLQAWAKQKLDAWVTLERCVLSVPGMHGHRYCLHMDKHLDDKLGHLCPTGNGCTSITGRVWVLHGTAEWPAWEEAMKCPGLITARSRQLWNRWKHPIPQNFNQTEKQMAHLLSYKKWWQVAGDTRGHTKGDLWTEK